MNRVTKKVCMILLATVMAFAMASCDDSSADIAISNKNFNCAEVAYGSYAQDVVTDAAVIAKLEGASWSYDNVAVVDNMEYVRLQATPASKSVTFKNGEVIVPGTTYYFAVTEIKWYVLSSAEGASVLFAKDILDVSVYNTDTEKSQSIRIHDKCRSVLNDNPEEVEEEFTCPVCGVVTADKTRLLTVYPNNWEFSTVRSWLNGEFADRAFSNIEKAAINLTRVCSNSSVSYYKKHTSAIADTWDQVYCLSYADTVNPEYGFNGAEESANAGRYDCMRMAEPTDYARARGASVYTSTASDERAAEWNGNGEYWLRTAGQSLAYAAIVRYTGETGAVYHYVNTASEANKNGSVGVRPAITVGFEF